MSLLSSFGAVTHLFLADDQLRGTGGKCDLVNKSGDNFVLSKSRRKPNVTMH